MARITQVHNVYLDADERDTPYMFESRSSRETETDDQHYERHLTATRDWQLINYAWVEEPSLVIIMNQEARPLMGGRAKLAPNQVLASSLAVDVGDISNCLEIAIVTEPVTANPVGHDIPPVFIVPPREMFQGKPGGHTRLCVRASGASPVKFSVVAFPK